MTNLFYSKLIWRITITLILVSLSIWSGCERRSSEVSTRITLSTKKGQYFINDSLCDRSRIKILTNGNDTLKIYIITKKCNALEDNMSKRRKCRKCNGTGRIFDVHPAPRGTIGNYKQQICLDCNGTGKRGGVAHNNILASGELANLLKENDMEENIKIWEQMIAYRKLAMKELRKEMRKTKDEIRRLEALISRANSHDSRAMA